MHISKRTLQVAVIIAGVLVAGCTETPTDRPLMEFAGDWQMINTASLSPDGSKVIALVEDPATAGAVGYGWHEPGTRSLIVADADTGRRLHTLPVADARKAGPGTLEFADDSCTVLAGGFVASLWDVCTGRKLYQFPNAWNDASAISPDGRTVALGLISSAAVMVWDRSTGRVRILDSGHPNASWVGQLVFNADGSRFAMAFADGEPGGVTRNGVQIWDVRSGRLISEADDRAFTASWAVRMRDDGSVFAVSASTRSPVDQRKRIVRWDSRTGDQVTTTALPTSLSSRAQNPSVNGRATAFTLVAERGTDTDVSAFDATTGAALTGFAALAEVDFADHGEAFVGCDRRSVRVWRNAKDPAPITLESGSAQSRCSASFDRAGRRILLSAGPTGGGPLQMFDGDDGRLLRQTP